MLNVPGAGLLGMALRLIQPQRVYWFKYESRALNEERKYVNTFAPAQVIDMCSVQAVPLTRYDFLGLDRKKKYVNWFVPAEVVGVDRDRSADEFAWNGRRYSVVNETPWNALDGWVEIMGVDIGAYTP